MLKVKKIKVNMENEETMKVNLEKNVKANTFMQENLNSMKPKAFNKEI